MTANSHNSIQLIPLACAEEREISENDRKLSTLNQLVIPITTATLDVVSLLGQINETLAPGT